MGVLTVHVECDRAGRWTVRRDTDVRPSSVHGSATEAEQAALALARTGTEIIVLVHDRYGRVRETSGRGWSSR